MQPNMISEKTTIWTFAANPIPFLYWLQKGKNMVVNGRFSQLYGQYHIRPLAYMRCRPFFLFWSAVTRWQLCLSSSPDNVNNCRNIWHSFQPSPQCNSVNLSSQPLSGGDWVKLIKLCHLVTLLICFMSQLKSLWNMWKNYIKTRQGKPCWTQRDLRLLSELYWC